MLSILIPSRLEPNIENFVRAVEYIIEPNQIVIYNDRYTMGKGFALREALKEATGDKIIFIDGDWDIQPYEINKLLPYIYQYDVVVGCKSLPKRWDRKLLTICSRLWIRLLFGLMIDTQTGLKAFNYKPEWKTNGFAFDIEILYKAKKEGRSIIGVPVIAEPSGRKGVKEIWSTLMETLRIRFQS